MDLSFKPVEILKLKKLSQENIATYNRDGFVQPFDVFNTEEMIAYRNYFDGLMARKGADGAYGINCYQARMKGIWEICRHPKILDYVEDIIGPNIICWASHLFSKNAHNSKVVPWHQDASYWKLSPARTVTVWLALDDADEENAAMRFIPGSHNKGCLEETKSTGDTVLNIETKGADKMGTPFSNVMKAGQISLHADMLVHGSLANGSDRRRCALTIRYCPPEVLITDPEWEKSVEAIICRGSDPTGTWKHHEKPINDDVLATTGPLGIID
ncbi:MAG: phytanoyl-CoA dioxygenase family protein [Kordiimonadaceae bacterium]|jgi:non-haem Fe2+, alpha-ketoglutarate-dependent halogenase|nr:phytanoyl-CoA dioxygenase family protein [Kordiimonadaceae bacterium]MBT6031055.1 phytanoyl-CoA dioxygenase family protein [Kordiimonadaceae bacterium]